MQDNLLYSALDLASFIHWRDMSASEKRTFLEAVWEHEKAFMLKEYRENKAYFIQQVHYWLSYINHKEDIDHEFPGIQDTASTIGHVLEAEEYLSDLPWYDEFVFKDMRLQILFIPGQDHIRMKRREFTKRFGYKRMTRELLEWLDLRLAFYHLQPYLRGREATRLGFTSPDDMIMFRVIDA